MDVAGGVLAKRIIPVVAGVVAVIIYLIAELTPAEANERGRGRFSALHEQ